MYISTTLFVIYVFGTSPTLMYCTYQTTKWTIKKTYSLFKKPKTV